MSEEDISKIATEVIKQLSSEIYGDALKPGMTEIGKALETVLGLGNTILTPFAMVNDQVKMIRERNLLRLQDKLKEIPEDKISEVHSEIAVPVLRALEYTQNYTLSEMFLNLLSAAANFDTAHQAHPSFVNIISNISPDEAKLLTYIKENKSLCYAGVRAINKDESFSDFKYGTTVLEVQDLIDFTDNVPVYISNLFGLGLIREYALPTNHPQTDLLHDYLKDEMDKVKQMEKVKSAIFTDGSYGLTPFGILFMECCTRNAGS